MRTCDAAVALAAAHWDVDPEELDVDGKPRQRMRWIGFSTHKADWDAVAMDRSWWPWSKSALSSAFIFAIALPIGLAAGDALGEKIKIHMEVKRAELERLKAENADSRAQVAAEEDAGKCCSPVRIDCRTNRFWRPEGASASHRDPDGAKTALAGSGRRRPLGRAGRRRSSPSVVTSARAEGYWSDYPRSCYTSCQRLTSGGSADRMSEPD